MKKYVWFLVAAAFALAIFAMVGCKPVTTPEASPSPAASPVVSPAPADKNCPKVVSTEVSKVTPTRANEYSNVRIRITFDEPITSTCIDNDAKWSITVANPGRVDKKIDGLRPNLVTLSTDGKKVDVFFGIAETYDYLLKELWVKFPNDDAFGSLADQDVEIIEALFNVGLIPSKGLRLLYTFEGLICSEDDAKAYVDVDAVEALVSSLDANELDAISGWFQGAAEVDDTLWGVLEDYYNLYIDLDEDGYIDEDEVEYAQAALLMLLEDITKEVSAVTPSAPKYADEVSWKLTNCVVCDDLGNCCCDYSGKDCCLEPVCEECACPTESAISGVCQ